jgi:hypothetical protein
MDNKAYLKKILSANIHISDKNKLDESLDAMFDDSKQLPEVGGNMVIHVDTFNSTADKTFDEIYEAIQQGIIPICVYDSQFYCLSYLDETDRCDFIHIAPSSDGITFDEISISNNNYVYQSFYTVPLSQEEE